MIITRTPLRIPLGGGGSDIPSFYEQHGGFWVSAAINRYVYVIVNQRFERTIRVSYSRTEVANSIDEVQHPVVREALRMLGIESGIEIVSVADLPANSGMGSSGSFTVGLLQALHEYRGEIASPRQLAEEAFEVEAVRLAEPVGKQDQYIAAYGGVCAFGVDRGGTVTVDPLQMSEATVHTLEQNLSLFYTGMTRRATEVLTAQAGQMRVPGSQAEGAMLRIMDGGHAVRDALEAGDCERFAELMNAHWQQKRQLTSQVAPGNIDHWYEAARAHGALGGKLIGAGGGGFFLFYCRPGDRAALTAAMAAEGLSGHQIKFTRHGTACLSGGWTTE